MSDFVEPKMDRLALSGGRWIEVKNRLNAGERRRVFSRMVKDMTMGQRTTLNPEMVGLTRLLEYLVGWSMTDGAGKSVAVSEAAINNLDPDLYEEMISALDAHEASVTSEREKEKNALAGGNTSPAISTLPGDAGGATSGLAH